MKTIQKIKLISEILFYLGCAIAIGTGIFYNSGTTPILDVGGLAFAILLFITSKLIENMSEITEEFNRLPLRAKARSSRRVM